MSSTLYFRKAPQPTKNIGSAKHPLKGIIAREYYEHDGSLNGEKIRLNKTDLEWLRGVCAAIGEEEDEKLLKEVIRIIDKEDRNVEVWITN